MVTASAVTMAVAVGYAADSTRRDSTAALQGHSAMRRIAKAIRSARLVGYYDTHQIVLWYDDVNGDDKVQLSETEVNWWDSATSQLKRTRPYTSTMSASQIALTDRIVTFAELSGSTYSQTITSAPNAETAILASDAVDFAIKSNGAQDTAGLVDLRITAQEGATARRFAISATPAAPADYLTSGTTSTNDGVSTRRYRRSTPRTWTVPTAAVQAW